MTDKQKRQDKRIWIRLGLELAALERLAGQIFCDPDYLAIMGKTRLRGLDKATHWITRIRTEADYLSYRQVPHCGPEWFFGYGVDPARELVDDSRQKLRQKAVTQEVKCEETERVALSQYYGGIECLSILAVPICELCRGIRRNHGGCHGGQ